MDPGSNNGTQRRGRGLGFNSDTDVCRDACVLGGGRESLPRYRYSSWPDNGRGAEIEGLFIRPIAFGNNTGSLCRFPSARRRLDSARFAAVDYRPRNASQHYFIWRLCEGRRATTSRVLL